MGMYVIVCWISGIYGIYDDIGDNQNGIELSIVFDVSRYCVMEFCFVIVFDDNVFVFIKIYCISQSYCERYLNENKKNVFLKYCK